MFEARSLVLVVVDVRGIRAEPVVNRRDVALSLALGLGQLSLKFERGAGVQAGLGGVGGYQPVV